MSVQHAPAGGFAALADSDWEARAAAHTDGIGAEYAIDGGTVPTA